jgi:hypothetical protein
LGGCRSRAAVLDETQDVVLCDATTDARAIYILEVHAMLFCNLPDERRGSSATQFLF